SLILKFVWQQQPISYYSETNDKALYKNIEILNEASVGARIVAEAQTEELNYDNSYQQNMAREDDYDQSQLLLSSLLEPIPHDSVKEVWKVV
ncbi:23624_t:CDS:2, partial [Gigaspora margarita]